MEEFRWIPDWGLEEEYVFNEFVTPLGDGYRQTVLQGLNSDLRKWSDLRFTTLPTSEVNELIQFLRDHKGGVVFTWQIPGSYPADIVKVVCRSCSKSLISPNNFSVSATFEEVP